MELATVNHGLIRFVRGYPDRLPFERITTSEPFKADLSYGSFFYQKVTTDDYVFWQHLYRPREDLLIHVNRDGYWCGFRVMLRSHVHHNLWGGAPLYLKQGQFNFVYSPVSEGSFRLKAGQEYHIFDMWVSLDFLQKLSLKAKWFQRFLSDTHAGKLHVLLEHSPWAGIKLEDALEAFWANPRNPEGAEAVIRCMVKMGESRRPLYDLTETQVEQLYDAKSGIVEELARWPGVPALAQKSHLNESTFKRGFKQVFGLTPYQFVKYERIKRAGQLLRETTLSVETVARQVGFDSLQAFAPVFKKAFQMTALQYRKNRQPRNGQAGILWPFGAG